eukprot:2273611-Prymnesium_polylepis.2
MGGGDVRPTSAKASSFSAAEALLNAPDWTESATLDTSSSAVSRLARLLCWSSWACLRLDCPCALNSCGKVATTQNSGLEARKLLISSGEHPPVQWTDSRNVAPFLVTWLDSALKQRGPIRTQPSLSEANSQEGE